MPWADVLYAADLRWWEERAPDHSEFEGERWSALHSLCDENERLADRGVNLVEATDGFGFVLRPPIEIGHFPHSGQAAIALAIAMFDARHITLVGFNLCRVDTRVHFWGDYARPFNTPTDTNFEQMRTSLTIAAASLPPSVRIVNATVGSALHCFDYEDIDTALTE